MEWTFASNFYTHFPKRRTYVKGTCDINTFEENFFTNVVEKSGNFKLSPLLVPQDQYSLEYQDLWNVSWILIWYFCGETRPPTAPKSSVGKNDDFLLATNFNAYFFFRFWGKKIAIPHNSPSKRSGQKKIQLLAPHYTHYDWCGQTKVEVVKNGHHTNLGFVHLPKILNTSRRRRIISTVIFIFWKNYCVSWTLLDNDGRRTSRFIYSAFTLSLP